MKLNIPINNSCVEMFISRLQMFCIPCDTNFTTSINFTIPLKFTIFKKLITNYQ